MRIAAGARYLVLHVAADGSRHRLAIEQNLKRVIGSWTAVTRVSPIWCVNAYDLKLPKDFSGHQDILFLGPVQPALIAAETQAARQPGTLEIWLTAGLLNVFARAPCAEGATSPAIDELVDFARRHGVPFERWRTNDGIVSSEDRQILAAREPKPLLDRLASLSISPSADTVAIEPALQEFVAIAASTLTRAAAMAPILFDDVSLTIDSIIKLIESYRADELEALDLVARLVTVNAALSRFSSQTFSGMPPIQGTECHFWIHSLLGTGSANLALAQLARWVQSVLGEARLHERMIGLANLRDDVPTREELMQDASFLDAKLLSRSSPDPRAQEPVIPLITYFSGRDGFCSYLQTLSAPLSTLAECNSYRSSLMTITHEISHVFIQAVLGTLYPNKASSQDLDAAVALMQLDERGGDWLIPARQLLLEGVFGLEQANGDSEIDTETLRERLPILLARWINDVQETMVHTFDFLYFYEREPNHYIKSIWYTWSAIPGIDFRVGEYVMRSLCSISVSLLNLHPTKRLRTALGALKAILSGMQGATTPNGFVAQAVAYIEGVEALAADDRKWSAIRQEYEARLCLVRLVQIFLYSEDLAAQLFSDPYAPDDKVVQVYDTKPIGNPLTFLRNRLKATPSEAESMWVLHSLAFDFEPRPSNGTA